MVKNIWGNDKNDVCEGYCEDCERAEPLHYDNCPKHVNTTAIEEFLEKN